MTTALPGSPELHFRDVYKCTEEASSWPRASLRPSRSGGSSIELSLAPFARQFSRSGVAARGTRLGTRGRSIQLLPAKSLVEKIGGWRNLLRAGGDLAALLPPVP